MNTHAERSRSPKGLNSAKRSEVSFDRCSSSSSMMLRCHGRATTAARRTKPRVRSVAKQVRGGVCYWVGGKHQPGKAVLGQLTRAVPHVENEKVETFWRRRPICDGYHWFPSHKPVLGGGEIITCK